MTQRTILTKLANYLDLVQSELTQSLKETSSIDHDQKVKDLDAELQLLRAQLKKGYCFGFSVLHGALDAIGKLQWWESALLTIANWNEKTTPLDTLIELPDSEENAFWQTKEEKENAEHVPTNKKAIKLRILLERVLAYLIHHQQGNSPLNNNQTAFLSLENSYFEIINNEGNILSIQKREVLAGYFDQAELEELLNVNDFSGFTGIIGYIYSNDHTIRIGFKEHKWLVYDPNYDHRTSESIHKYFRNKTDLTNEIIRILGNSLVIEVNSFEPRILFSLPRFGLSKPNQAINRIRDLGIHLIARHCPDTLAKAINLAADAPKGSELIAKALTTQSNDGWSGLHLIARYSPNTLEKMLDLAARAPDGTEFIAKALATQNNDGWTPLYIIARCSPNTLEKTLDLAARAPDGSELIAKALATQNNDGWTPLYIIARYSPNTLEKTLDLAARAPDGPELIAKALTTQSNDAWNALLWIARFCPNTLEKALDLAARAPEGPELIAKALTTQSNDGWSGLHLIARYSSNTLEKALDLAARAPEGPEFIAKALVTQNNNGLTGLHMIVRYCSEALKKTIDLARRVDNGSGLIAQALVTQNTEGMSAADIIAELAPKALLKMFEYTTQSLLEVCPQDYFHIIYKYAPSLLKVKPYTLLVQSSNKELLATALSSKKDDLSGFDILIQTKPLPSQLIEILKFTAANTSLDTSSLSQDDSSKLSYAHFIELIERYMAPNHQPNFFPLNDPGISPANANWLLRLNAATSDVHRYELAQDLIKQNPREPLAELLLEAIKPSLTQHVICVC